MKYRNINRTILYIVFAIFCYSFSCKDDARYDIVDINNKTNRILYVVISTEYPNTYLPIRNFAWNIILPNAELSTIRGEVSRSQFFRDCIVMQILVYQINQLSPPSSEYLRENHCEVVRYEFSKKEIEDADWTITVTDEDIFKYQATHETVLMPVQ